MKKLLFIWSALLLFACMQGEQKGDGKILTKAHNQSFEKIDDAGKGILNNLKSPYVKLKSINMGECQWTEGFWADKFKICEEAMVPYMGKLLTGDIGHALNNFKIAAGLKEGKHKGMHWHDGDFYKWIEAACYIYAVNKDEKLLTELDEYIDIIGQAQEDDGYLSTQITNRGLPRFANRKYHELYNSGHLLTSACIHYRVSGKLNFLHIAIKHADYLYDLFQPQPAELARFGFNQTQIMGLVELYRTTKDRRYLELAEIFINMRGKSKVEPDPTVRYRMVGDMVQERTPIREETEAVGHAVLALYFYAGAADVAAETGEKALVDALDRLWDNVTNKKMYITGAVGQAHHGASSQSDGATDFVHEAFLDEYMMPNATAYNETCANICNAMFNWRMLNLSGEAKHVDVIEQVLFNSGLSGIDEGGTNYFYSNPLRMIEGMRDYSALSTESAVRTPYIACFCCPPNLVRTIAKLSGWAYSLAENGIAVNLYGGNKLDTKLLDGTSLKLHQESAYPWQGAVKITIDECKSSAFEMWFRIPGWADGAEILVNGKKIDMQITQGEYAKIERSWQPGDVIELNLPMGIKLMEGNPRIEEVRNQVAIQRGPVVYCVESPDLPENTSILDVYLPANSKLKAQYRPDFLGGISTIEGDILLRESKKTEMYSRVSKLNWQKKPATFVPYFAWANRGLSEMTVWLPVVWN